MARVIRLHQPSYHTFVHTVIISFDLYNLLIATNDYNDVVLLFNAGNKNIHEGMQKNTA